MGSLATYLQRQSVDHPPPGWIGRREVSLLSPELGRLLGFSPQADVLLERADGSRRLWIEFEVSRADPVANHAKFASAHLFQPQLPADAFVAMLSPHVARGRRNLAATATFLMRAVGMAAHQTVLFPFLDPADVQRLNHAPPELIAARSLDVAAELDRAVAVAESRGRVAGASIHFAGDVLEVLLNARRWNDDIATPPGAALWGARAATYFVHDPTSGLFAPAKFCAYVPLARPVAGAPLGWQPMTVATYAAVGPSEPIFDGHRAWTHLSNRLGMRLTTPDQDPALAERFSHWLAPRSPLLRLRGAPTFLLPPRWF